MELSGVEIHWHVILWWQKVNPVGLVLPGKTTPVLKGDWSCVQSFWPHGHSKYVECNNNKIAYVAGYVSGGQSAHSKQIKQPKREADRVIAKGSKNPLVGGRFFDDLARRHVDQGLAPQDKSYSFDCSRTRSGMKFDYWMGPSAKEYFCRRYIHHWRRRHGNAHPPVSEMLMQYDDDLARRECKELGITDADILSEMAKLRENSGRHLRKAVYPPTRCPVTGVTLGDDDTRFPVTWDHSLLVWRYPARPESGVQTLYWCPSDTGGGDWYSRIIDPKSLRARRAHWDAKLEEIKRLHGRSRRRKLPARRRVPSVLPSVQRDRGGRPGTGGSELQAKLNQ